MSRDYTREALLAAAESPHDPHCLTRKYHVPTDGLCTCHVGKARFALDIDSMSFAEHAQLVAAELLPAEKSGPIDGYDAAWRRALVKRAKKNGRKAGLSSRGPRPSAVMGLLAFASSAGVSRAMYVLGG